MATAWIEVPASAGDFFVPVKLDLQDHERLDGRALSIGSHGYAQMWDNPRVMLLHRWILGVPHGTGYRVIADHINRNPLDCRRSNLRLVSPSESNLNRVIKQGRYPTGVRPNGRGFSARVKRNRVTKHLGTFPTIEEAAAVRSRYLEGS